MQSPIHVFRQTRSLVVPKAIEKLAACLGVLGQEQAELVVQSRAKVPTLTSFPAISHAFPGSTFPARPHPPRAVYCVMYSTERPCVSDMLIGACNPVVCPTHVSWLGV